MDPVVNPGGLEGLDLLSEPLVVACTRNIGIAVSNQIQGPVQYPRSSLVSSLWQWPLSNSSKKDVRILLWASAR